MVIYDDIMQPVWNIFRQKADLYIGVNEVV